MAKLIYMPIASADGYIEDADGKFDWATPDDELLRLVNELVEPIGTYLFGRRMYETMAYWETAGQIPGQPPLALDFMRIWQAADKIVFSSTLDAPVTARTRLERSFDPALIQQLKHDASADLTVAGADLAGQALRAGLVDELHLFLVPAIVGGGKRALPADARLDLELLDTRRLASGAVHLHYRIKPG
jgi:dihydrofolate reductase